VAPKEEEETFWIEVERHTVRQKQYVLTVLSHRVLYDKRLLDFSTGFSNRTICNYIRTLVRFHSFALVIRFDADAQAGFSSAAVVY
jgi:hypothetical protein